MAVITFGVSAAWWMDKDGSKIETNVAGPITLTLVGMGENDGVKDYESRCMNQTAELFLATNSRLGKNKT